MDPTAVRNLWVFPFPAENLVWPRIVLKSLKEGRGVELGAWGSTAGSGCPIAPALQPNSMLKGPTLSKTVVIPEVSIMLGPEGAVRIAVGPDIDPLVSLWSLDLRREKHEKGTTIPGLGVGVFQHRTEDLSLFQPSEVGAMRRWGIIRLAAEVLVAR